MPETSTLEASFRAVRDLYDTICREADEDRHRDDDERALIARVGEKLAQLQAQVRALRTAQAGPDGAPGGQADPAGKGSSPDASALAAWKDLSEDVATIKELASAATVQDGLRDEGFPHADALARLVTAMDAAADADDWQDAVNRYHAAKAYADAEDLWTEIGIDAPLGEDEEDEDEEPEEDPEKARWEKWQFLDAKLRTLVERLAEAGHPLTDRLGALLDEVAEARDKGEYARATDLLVDEAAGFANDQDLWATIKSMDEGNLLPDLTLDQILRLRDLSRDLTRLKHQKAVEFDALVAPIPRVVTEFSALMPAGRAVEKAWTFADRHALWAAVPVLPTAEVEWIFWETNGARYRDLGALLRKREQEGRPEVAMLGEKMSEVDAALEKEQFHLAGMHLDAAEELAEESGLYEDASGDEAGEDTGGTAGTDRINPLTAAIGNSVGRGGRNDPADVKTVQHLLNRQGADLVADGQCGRLTIAAIEGFQKRALGFQDGRVDPDGRTFGALTGKAVVEDMAEEASALAKKASRAATDAAGALADAVGDAIGSAGSFLDDLLGDGGDGRS